MSDPTMPAALAMILSEPGWRRTWEYRTRMAYRYDLPESETRNKWRIIVDHDKGGAVLVYAEGNGCLQPIEIAALADRVDRIEAALSEGEEDASGV